MQTSSLHASNVDAERVARNSFNRLEDLALSSVEHSQVAVATGCNYPVFAFVFAHSESHYVVDFSDVKSQHQVRIDVI
jgi:hypothetical protein